MKESAGSVPVQEDF